MKKLGIWERIEQFLRVLSLICYTYHGAIYMLIDPALKPLHSFINRVCGNFFSKRTQQRDFMECFIKKWARDVMRILGIEVIVENNGVNMMI